MRKIMWGAGALLIGISVPAFAQDAVEEVVITAPFAVSLDSVTTNVDILTRNDIDIATSGGLGDLLSGIAGIRSSFFGPGASRPVIRGLAGPRVLVLTNGIGLIDASALSPDHQVATDPGEAERIEVLRGPAALAYGGSALGGVVNVIDGRVARTPAVGGYSGRLSSSGSSVDDGFAFSGALKAGEGPFVFTLDGLHRASEDYAIPVPAESRRQMTADAAGEEKHADIGTAADTAVRLTSYGTGLSFVGSGGFFGLSMKRTTTRYGVPGPSHVGEEKEKVVIDLKQTRIDLHSERNMDFGPFTLARIAAGYADYEHVELEDGAVGTRFLSDGYEGRFELVQEKQSGRQGAIGVQILHRNLDAIGDEAYVPRTRVDEAGLFTLQRLDNEAWGVEGGLRIDGRDLESTAGSRSFVNVSVSGGVFARPAEPWFFGLALSRTVRSPTEAELFANGAHVATRGFEIGDSGLGSEVSYSADATACYNTGRFSADMHFFAAIYDNFIDLRPTGAGEDGLAVFVYDQTAASFYGFEAEISFRLWQEGAGSFTLEGVADFVRGDTDNGVPARIPSFSVTGRAVVTGSSWLAQFEIRHVAGQHRVTAFELPTDGYTMLNGRFEFRPSTADGLTVFASVRNLGDVEAREHTSFLKDVIPLPGRSFRIGTAYRF